MGMCQDSDGGNTKGGFCYLDGPQQKRGRDKNRNPRHAKRSLLLGFVPKSYVLGR